MTFSRHSPTTLLFVPGDRHERFDRAAQAGADAVIIDLEDAVDPDKKDAARENARKHVLQTPVFVRINAAGTPWHEADVAMLRRGSFAGVMLPKADDPAIIAALSDGGQLPVIPLVETASGLLSLPRLLSSTGVMCAAFGSLDYALDLRCDHAWEPMLSARSEIVFQSKICGVGAPIDGVTADVENINLAAEDARRARSLGFGGKLLIHPRQVEPVRTAFTPSDDEHAWAAAVIEAIAAGATGALRVNGKLVDQPIIQRARRILDED